jgi:proteasome-associated ATPase
MTSDPYASYRAAMIEAGAPPEPMGDVLRVTHVDEEKHIAYVQIDPVRRRVIVIQKDVKLRVGSSVIVDQSVSAALALAIDDKPAAIPDTAPVEWDDVGGLKDAKRILRAAIEGPRLHKALYEKYNRKPLKGILLHGPPGCGKTLLGKAAATGLARGYGKASPGFLYVKGPELLNCWVGSSEANVRKVFDAAREFEREQGYPCLVFVDEAESLLGKRVAGSPTLRIENTVVPQFLAEMDGFGKSGAMVVLATNRPDALDPAVVREGRIDRKLYIGRPEEEDVKAIAKRLLESRPVDKDTDPDVLAGHVASELFKHSKPVARFATENAEDHNLLLKHILSGATVAAIVDLATDMAIEEDVKSDSTGGVSVKHVDAAIDTIYKESVALDHKDEVLDFASKTTTFEVVSIRRPIVSEPVGEN